MNEAVDVRLLEKTLDEIRPTLQGDGGDLVLRGVDEKGAVTIELLGACKSCPLQIVTLAAGIEAVVQRRVPGVSGVVAYSPAVPEPSDAAHPYELMAPMIGQGPSVA